MRKGRQEPTFEVQCEYAYTAGADAAAYFEEAGLSLIPAQRHELDAMLARREDGSFAATTVGVCRPRQNGKSFAARLYAVWMAAVMGMNVLYSAHLGSTVTKFFRMLCALFASPDRYPMFSGLLDGIYKQPGREGIYLANGACIEFQTRTAGSARGDSYSVIVIDEAQYLTDAQQDSILPTASSTGVDPQIIEIGTPPNRKAPGECFKRDHDAAHRGDAEDLWWMEWSIADLPSEGATVDELMELAYQTNPMLGYRMSERALKNEMGRMSRDGLAVERLGWWSKAAASAAIPERAWRECRTDAPERGGTTCFAAKFSADGLRGSVAACVKQSDGSFLVLGVDSREMGAGSAWASEFLAGQADKAAQIVVDGRAHSESVLMALRAAKVPRKALVEPSAADVANACALFLDAVNQRDIRHTSQPALDHSAMNSSRRKVGSTGGWAFEGARGCDPTLIEACALAYWQCATTKRNPDRKLRMG